MTFKELHVKYPKSINNIFCKKGLRISRREDEGRLQYIDHIIDASDKEQYFFVGYEISAPKFIAESGPEDSYYQRISNLKTNRIFGECLLLLEDTRKN